MKVLERVLQSFYCSQVDINNMQFDFMPRHNTMRKLGINEWSVRLVKVIYNEANSRVRVNSCFSERFEVTVGVHQGSVLSPLLFAIVKPSLVSVVLVALGRSYIWTILLS